MQRYFVAIFFFFFFFFVYRMLNKNAYTSTPHMIIILLGLLATLSSICTVLHDARMRSAAPWALITGQSGCIGLLWWEVTLVWFVKDGSAVIMTTKW